MGARDQGYLMVYQPRNYLFLYQGETLTCPDSVFQSKNKMMFLIRTCTGGRELTFQEWMRPQRTGELAPSVQAWEPALLP